MIPVYERVEGPVGTAEPIPIPSTPDAAETMSRWLVTSPAFHPAWSQYEIGFVRLRDDIAGFPPPIRQFPGATHELLVMALDPRSGPHTPASLELGPIPFMTPLNIVEQFEATDDEMRAICSLLAQAVVHGVLTPEPEGIIGAREAWLSAVVKSLAHMRGEEHAP